MVLTTAEGGREIVLYRVEPRQTCIPTTSCLLLSSYYDTYAVAVEVTETIILPKPAFHELIATSARFRQFAFSTYGERLHTLICLVQEVILKYVDRSLTRYLLHHAHNGVVTTTHQALAQELNTAREMVTRLLHDFVQKVSIYVTGERIRQIAAKALRRLKHPSRSRKLQSFLDN